LIVILQKIISIYKYKQTMYTFVYIKLKLIEGVKKVAFGENLQLHFLLSGILALI